MKTCSDKKSDSKNKIPLFNKENALAFADQLYSQGPKGGIKFTKLCNGSLVQWNAPKFKDKKALHCTIGEAYFHFVSQNMNWAIKSEDSGRDPTATAIERLIKKAVLADSATDFGLHLALGICVRMNDNETNSNYLKRAKQVAKTWKERVVPLLK